MITQSTKSISEWSGESRASIARWLAFLFCLFASAVGWAAIIGLLLLLKPELPF